MLLGLKELLVCRCDGLHVAELGLLGVVPRGFELDLGPACSWIVGNVSGLVGFSLASGFSLLLFHDHFLLSLLLD